MKKRTMARIPDLGLEWKVILEIKKHTHFGDIGGNLFSIGGFRGGAMPGIVNVNVKVHLTSTSLGLVHEVIRDQNRSLHSIECSTAPKVGKWTRIEVSQQEEDGRHFLALSVEGNESGREEISGPDLFYFSDTWIDLGTQGALCGDVRRLVVLN